MRVDAIWAIYIIPITVINLKHPVRIKLIIIFMMVEMFMDHIALDHLVIQQEKVLTCGVHTVLPLSGNQ